MSTKKKFFARHSKSSALVVSVGIHALLIVVALSFVAVTVIQKDEAVSMEALLGEDPGGVFYCQLYIQQEGMDYPTRSERYTDPDTNKSEVLQRPILPVFKTADIPDELAKKMEINSSWATLEGPSFGVVK